MELSIDPKLIVGERNKRAWSQSHLAEVSGLSLRTIQRIENTGKGSLESIKSIAAVFDVNIESLTANSRNKYRKSKPYHFTIGGIFGIFLTLGGFVFLSASADPIMVDISLTSNDKNIANVQLLNEESEDSEVIVNKQIKLNIISQSVPENKIRLSTKLYLYANDEYSLISSPVLVISNNKSAEIQFKTESGKMYTMQLTPHLSSSD